MTAAVELEAPKVIDVLSADDYHADKTSISSSGLRALLNPGCPAQFKYDRDHPQAPKREFDMGNAVHAEVLGEGHDIVEIVGFSDYKKADARAARDAAYAAGKVPLAGPLFAPGSGKAEQSIYWTDLATGVRCRVRPDWLKQLPGTTLCVDLKTIKDAAPDTISRAIRDHNYHQQDPLYIDGIEAAGLAPEGCRFIFVFVSKIAPYLITVRELTDQDRDIGRARNERALRLYADCVANDDWPDWTGPVTEIPQIGMPTWDTLRQAEEYL